MLLGREGVGGRRRALRHRRRCLRARLGRELAPQGCASRPLPPGPRCDCSSTPRPASSPRGTGPGSGHQPTEAPGFVRGTSSTTNAAACASSSHPPPQPVQRSPGTSWTPQRPQARDFELKPPNFSGLLVPFLTTPRREAKRLLPSLMLRGGVGSAWHPWLSWETRG